jgi:hypothetical protein
MNWQDYEDLVRDIYKKLGEAAGVRILCHGKSCKVKGKSGVKHQIDVLTEHSDGIHSYKTAIECKYWNDNVNKDVVAKVSEILEDAQIEKGVIVSKVGFTSDAKNFAKYKNISIVELREPSEDDWRGKIREIHINLKKAIPNRISNLQFDVPAEHKNNLSPFQIRTFPSEMIFISEGKEKSLQYLIDERLKHGISENQKSIQYEIHFPSQSEMQIKNESFKIPVKAVRFSLDFSFQESQVEIKGAEYVSMIMHCIFEKKRFIIDKNKQIRGS